MTRTSVWNAGVQERIQKSAEFHSRQPQEKQEDVHTLSTWPVAWHFTNEVFGLVRVTSPLTMKY